MKTTFWEKNKRTICNLISVPTVGNGWGWLY